MQPKHYCGLLAHGIFLQGRDFAIPEDVQAILPSVAEHRLRSELTDLSDDQMLSELLIDAVNPIIAQTS